MRAAFSAATSVRDERASLMAPLAVGETEPRYSLDGTYRLDE